MELDYEILVGPFHPRIFWDSRWFCQTRWVSVLFSRTGTLQAASGGWRRGEMHTSLAYSTDQGKSPWRTLQSTQSIKHPTLSLSLYSHCIPEIHPAFPVNSNRKGQKQPKENGKTMKETQTTLYIQKSNPLALQALGSLNWAVHTCCSLNSLISQITSSTRAAPTRAGYKNELHWINVKPLTKLCLSEIANSTTAGLPREFYGAQSALRSINYSCLFPVEIILGKTLAHAALPTWMASKI